MRTTEVQDVPFVEVLITMSFALQPERNRQSCHTTYTVPPASTSAEGRGGLRSDPATPCRLIEETLDGPVKLAPPFVDTNAWTDPSNPSSIGTITVPFGCASGCPPMTELPGTDELVHVSPPSVDRLILNVLPVPLSSHSE